MPYLIYALDFADKDHLRESFREAHREHLRSVGSKLLASGALLGNDKKTVIGGISLLDTESRDEAEAFAFNDPYSKIDIRKEVHVIPWRKRWWNGEFLPSNS